MVYLTPPGRVEHRGGNHPLFGRLKLTRGVSLLKEDGVYRQVQYPTAEEIDAAEAAYLGGHVYEVPIDEVIALDGAGYGDYVTYLFEYGMDIFGVGPYGGEA